MRKGEAMIERPRDRSHEVRGRDREHIARECLAREGPKYENIKVHHSVTSFLLWSALAFKILLDVLVEFLLF